MGYTTDFYGSVSVEPPLNEHGAVVGWADAVEL